MSSQEYIDNIKLTNPCISFQFLAFDLEDHYDILTIQDGPTSYDRVIAVYSGTELPSSITATTNFLLVTFTSDYSIENTGFQAVWEPGIVRDNHHNCIYISCLLNILKKLQTL